MPKKKTTQADADANAGADAAGKVVVQSDDGGILFRMRMTRFGLWVRRERRRGEERALLVQSIIFSDTCGFERWCDSDPIRFAYPVISHAIRREGSALLDHHEPPPAAEPDHPER